jgi:MAF protein
MNKAFEAAKNNNLPLILASTSKYKRQLLEKLISTFDVQAPNVAELSVANESPEQMAIRLATEKAQAVFQRFPEHTVIGADQVCSVDIPGEPAHVLGKPGTVDKAIEQLTLCSGKTVRFYTAISVYVPSRSQPIEYCETTLVEFRALSAAAIRQYVAIEKPLDCAGSFKSEGLGIRLFNSIQTRDPNALIGLPLIGLVDIFNQLDIEVLNYRDKE